MSELIRFIKAQETTYPQALTEITNGRKQSHWMWYIFPQISGLGMSQTSIYYSLKNISEAMAYLDHPLLGARLVEISNVLLNSKHHNAHAIFGSPDDLKLKSCMTLFCSLQNANPVFGNVLDMYFEGKKDERTMGIIQKEAR